MFHRFSSMHCIVYKISVTSMNGRSIFCSDNLNVILQKYCLSRFTKILILINLGAHYFSTEIKRLT